MIDGKVTYEAVAEAHGLEYTPLDARSRWSASVLERRGFAGFFFVAGRRAELDHDAT